MHLSKHSHVHLQILNISLLTLEITHFIAIVSHLSPPNVSNTEHEFEDAVSPTDNS